MAFLSVNKDMGKVSRLEYVEDLRMVHPRLRVNWRSNETASFTAEDTIEFMNIEYSPVSIKYNFDFSGAVYSGVFYPAILMRPLDTLCKSMSEVAAAFNSKLSDESTDSVITFPLQGVMGAPLLYKYRYQSYEENIDLPEKSSCIFFGWENILCMPYEGLPKQESLEIPYDININYSIANDICGVSYVMNHVPQYKQYARWVSTMFGVKVEVSCPGAGKLGHPYKFKFGDPTIDNLSNMVLVRKHFRSNYRVNPWVLTFAQLDYPAAETKRLTRYGYTLPEGE